MAPSKIMINYQTSQYEALNFIFLFVFFRGFSLCLRYITIHGLFGSPCIHSIKSTKSIQYIRYIRYIQWATLNNTLKSGILSEQKETTILNLKFRVRKCESQLMPDFTNVTLVHIDDLKFKAHWVIFAA